jgi:hypothetical protein
MARIPSNSQPELEGTDGWRGSRLGTLHPSQEKWWSRLAPHAAITGADLEGVGGLKRLVVLDHRWP